MFKTGPFIAPILVTLAANLCAAQDSLDVSNFPHTFAELVTVDSGTDVSATEASNGSRTLETLQQMALSSNPTIIQAQSQIDAARAAAWQAGLRPNPNIGYVAEQIGVNGTAGELQGAFISQEFVRGNKLGLSRAKYFQRVQIAQTNFIAQQSRVRNDVATRFFHALAAQQIVEIHQRIVETAADDVQTHKEMLNLGQLGEAEVLQAEIDVQRERLKLRQANNDLQQAWHDLMAFVGTPQMRMTPLVGSLDAYDVPLEWEVALNQLLSTSPQLVAARQKIRHDQIAIQREQAEPISNVTVDLTVGQNIEAGQTVAGVAISLPVPIWNRNEGTVRQARADLRRTHAEIYRLELQLRTEMAKQYRDYLSAWQHVQEYQQTMLPKSKTAVEKLDQAYQDRRAPWRSVLAAKRMLLDLELEQIDNLLTYQISDISIRGNLLMGGLTEPDGPIGGGHIDAVAQPR